MAQADKTGAETGTKGTDVPDVPSARFTARNSTFRCSANRMICAFRHEDSGMFQETRNQKPVVISFMAAKATVGPRPSGVVAPDAPYATASEIQRVAL